MYTGKLTMKNGKLVFSSPQDKLGYSLLLQKLSEGQAVEMYIDLANSDHSKAQLAKIHACIRELAKESGYTFSEMKDIVKGQSGLCYKNDDGSDYCKSFADCSKDEISLAIEACIEIGKYYNLNL
jgi:hypothetical protein